MRIDEVDLAGSFVAVSVSMKQRPSEPAAAGCRVRFGSSQRDAEPDISILSEVAYSFRSRNLILEKIVI